MLLRQEKKRVNIHLLQRSVNVQQFTLGAMIGLIVQKVKYIRNKEK